MNAAVKSKGSVSKVIASLAPRTHRLHYSTLFASTVPFFHIFPTPLTKRVLSTATATKERCTASSECLCSTVALCCVAAVAGERRLTRATPPQRVACRYSTSYSRQGIFGSYSNSLHSTLIFCHFLTTLKQYSRMNDTWNNRSIKKTKGSLQGVS